MNEDICAEFIHHLDQNGSLECGSAPDHIVAWIDDLNHDALRIAVCSPP